ncbi:hypothetical protein PLESTB_000316400 [Pleodorina starrii]|uniref:Uncharacterized protein n=1 Tax=Pleodorina starrii TaxID=330485 RepID=A0A9W6EYC8_9CHLO|nr:hypothetical protein PLESTB_000316400 [Pleodorina starrii]
MREPSPDNPDWDTGSIDLGVRPPANEAIAKRLQLSSQITASARATLEPSIGASLIQPIFWAEEASEISAVQAARHLPRRSLPCAVRRGDAARRVVLRGGGAGSAGWDGGANGGGGRPGRRRWRITTTMTFPETAAPPAPPPTPAPVAAASAAAFKPGAAPVPPPRSPAGPVTAPNPAPPETAAAPAPSAVATTGGGVDAGAGFGAGLLAPFLAMPDTADERTLQLLDEEDEDGGGEGEGEG